MTFGSKVLDFHFNLPKELPLSEGVEVIYPFKNEDTINAMNSFYQKFYKDDEKRILIFGINPGRHGAGVTGIGFTDPKKLEDRCGIPNPFPKKVELSSDFIYEVIDGFGGPEVFFSKFLFTSVSPIGFLKNNRNYNYYDDKDLLKKTESFIVSSIRSQMNFGVPSNEIVCLGQGQNFKQLKLLNNRYKLFDKIHVLPHPRWVMQYRRKEKEIHLSKYLETLHNILSSKNTK